MRLWRTRLEARKMRRTAALFMLMVACVSALSLSSCTVYPDKKPATLESTTSAEHVQRIFWQDVAASKWVQANALLAPKAVWRVGDRIIPREQIIPWLQSAGIQAVQVTGVTLQPAVNDMNLVYTLQLQAAHVASGADCGSQPQNWSAVAVWQQPQPMAAPPAQNEKQYRGYLLTVHDLTLTGNSACR